jgi:hypothetical protein
MEMAVQIQAQAALLPAKNPGTHCVRMLIVLYMNDIANANTLRPLPRLLIVFQGAQLPPPFDAEVVHGDYKSVQHRLDRCHPFS